MRLSQFTKKQRCSECKVAPVLATWILCKQCHYIKCIKPIEDLKKSLEKSDRQSDNFTFMLGVYGAILIACILTGHGKIGMFVTVVYLTLYLVLKRKELV